jgi:hypothetical protein
MSDTDNVTDLHRPIDFTIDGRAEQTTTRKQPAAALLRLAGLDPALYDLGELRGHQPNPVRYADTDTDTDTDIVEIHQGDRFVSIRQRADVA